MALARRMAGFAGSPTLGVSAMARTLRAKGRDVVDFGSGEPDFDTPEPIKQAAVKALREGFTKYTAPAGIDELKEPAGLVVAPKVWGASLRPRRPL
jgi:aspartate aminotransferase